HAKAPSKVVLDANTQVDLNTLIAEDPERTLGQDVARQYGQLPYLFKVLDVANPLSIQVHPTKSQAETGFERENKQGIPLDSPERNYKDKNHKPELMVALSDFWLLHGFLPEAQITHVLSHVQEFHVFREFFEHGGYAELYRHVMTLPQEEVDGILRPLANRIRTQREVSQLEPFSADYWMARMVRDRGSSQYDRGMFSIYFFNLVHLSKGQAIFQDAGIPHAYLQGQNIEIMANSDNVLRGGLTEKHVDVSELLSTIRFEGVRPRVVEGTDTANPHEASYESPVQDFRLSRIHLEGDAYTNSTHSTEIVLVMDGVAATESGRERLTLSRGQSIVTFGESTYRIWPLSEEAVLFRVAVP
ncbi:MAG: mannose-6-phosphate isomerase, class I, partial [Anaerolineae bacterium]